MPTGAPPCSRASPWRTCRWSSAPRPRDWGTIVTVDLRLESATPGVATRAQAGKVVRRLKALAETGEVPTTARNPAARSDAAEEES